jgi:hypothetical protein
MTVPTTRWVTPAAASTAPGSSGEGEEPGAGGGGRSDMGLLVALTADRVGLDGLTVRRDAVSELPDGGLDSVEDRSASVVKLVVARRDVHRVSGPRLQVSDVDERPKREPTSW